MKHVTVTPVKQQVSAEEWDMRVDLAAAHRLIALYGWDDLVFTHVSARVPKIDLTDRKIMDSPYEINPAGFTIHSCIHAARQDVACVMHIHSLNGVAVAAQKQGLLTRSNSPSRFSPASARRAAR